MINKIDLNGDWKVRWADGQRGGLNFHRDEQMDPVRWIEAQVPGEIHLDLIKAGIIEEPYTGTNCLKSRWVDDCIWTYRKTFEAPAAALEEKAWLNFEGLDYEAKVYLNGEVVGTHANYYRPAKIEVTGKLKPGTNVLMVELESGLYHVSEKPITGYHNNCSDIPLHKRVWLRKPQCSFGWDWSTRLINLGIHKPVSLEWDPIMSVEQFAVLSDLTDDLKKGSVKITVAVKSTADEPFTAKLTGCIPGLNALSETEVEVVPGNNDLTLEIDVDAPELWWPNGHGKQNLYEVNAKLSHENRLVAEHDTKVGFRKIHVNQEKHPEKGTFFIFEINNRKIFAKGANYVPSDMIFQKIDQERSYKLVDLAVDTNFNFLRVWGGGLYETDDFYTRCDEKGIMVWQDFMYACGGYPTTDDTFMANVKAEALFQIRRLATHASLVAWCGNNEQEWHTYNKIEGVLYPDYALYHLILPRMLNQEDPTRHYQPSSPYSPGFEHPYVAHTGDQHPWSAGLTDGNFRRSREDISRFANEGGYIGPNSLPTLQSCLPEGQEFNNSFAWQIHDIGVDSWRPESYSDKIIMDWFNKDPRAMSIENFVYYSGFLQGEGLREFINNYRRRKFNSSGAIFWMFNDCWPAVRSWSIIDYYFRKTPGYYPVRRAFAPVDVVVVREDSTVKVFGVNDGMQEWAGSLKYGVFTMAGEYLLRKTKDTTIPANTSELLVEFSDVIWEESGFDNALAFASLYGQDSSLIARNRLILPQFHELNWPESGKLNMRYKDGKLIFSSATFCMGVCLDLDGEIDLPDNFFDVWPGEDYILPWPKDKSIPQVINYISS